MPEPTTAYKRQTSLRTPWSSIRELMTTDEAERNPSWLEDALQNAIALEFSTIPPYLCAWWSIKDRTHPVAESIKTILLEEMKHMGLACNLLAGIGGRPNLRLNIPFPGPLPGDVHPGLIAELQGLSYDALHLFMQIEYPEFGPIARTRAVSYPTIGAFYTAILEAFQRLNPPLDPTKQLVSSPDIKKVNNLAEVASAIETIKREGEGSRESPADTGTGRTDLAHYYRFGEVFYGKEMAYHEATEEWRFSGADVAFPDVWPMARTPERGYEQAEVRPEVWDLLLQCDTLFTTMMEQLHAAWDPANPSPADLVRARGTMRALSVPARALMQQELPTRRGTYGPCFRLLAPSQPENTMANRPTSFALHIRPLFSAGDIAGMSGIIDLTSYAEVKAASAAIVERIKKPADSPALMPPAPPTGTGPWPQEWIALFERWVAEGHPA